MVQRMTRAGYDALQAEIEHLETVERVKMAEQIKTAREFGDLKENAEYHAAKDASGHLETRILKLKDQLASAHVIEVQGGDVVAFGSTVEVEDDAGRKSSYTMVSAHEADPPAGKVSIDSPIGAALEGSRAGEDAVVKTPRGERRLKVISVA